MPDDSDLVENVEVRVVKWIDNRVVMFTFAPAEPKSECKRYDKKKSQSIVLLLCRLTVSLCEVLI